jgi:hypothetical protein
MVQKVANGRYEVERVDGTTDVWWVYDYRQRKAAFVEITPATAGGVKVLNEDTGVAHIVDANAHCDCKAGRVGRYCYHVAAVTGRAMELRRERSAEALRERHPVGEAAPAQAGPAGLHRPTGRPAGLERERERGRRGEQDADTRTPQNPSRRGGANGRAA